MASQICHRHEIPISSGSLGKKIWGKDMKNEKAVLFFAALVCLMGNVSAYGAVKPTCDADNGGLTLPSGFCAQVTANNLGALRHAVVAENGDLYIALQQGKGAAVALRDADHDGKYETVQYFGSGSTTGIYIRNGYLYLAQMEQVIRFKLTPGQLAPSGDAEVIVEGLPKEREHHDKGIGFDGKGSLYINLGSPSNACQAQDRQPQVKGQEPCPLLETHGGVWRFDENKLHQKESDGERWVTGLRQEPAITWHDGAVYIVMNSRDSLDTLWPGKFTAEENATRPAEPMFRGEKGMNFGWPYCFWDYKEQRQILNPEYGGDGKSAGKCSDFTPPVASYPPHSAPVDVIFYNSSNSFPSHYKQGAFIAFHGSWNRTPLPMELSNITFQPFTNGKPSGKGEIFASGFAGKPQIMSQNDGLARADGVAEAPDGSLFITDSQGGKVWHVFYTGKK
jgi:glucose/arabinose dehydrogenase